MIKGSTLRLRTQFVRERWGDAGLARVLGRLDRDAAEIVSKALPIGWYPLALSARVDELICLELARGDARIYDEMGAYSAESFAQQIYTSYFEEVTPERFLRLTVELYHHHYRNAGTRRNHAPGPGRMELYVDDCPEPYIPNCTSNAGFIRRSLELLGVRDVTCQEVVCAARVPQRRGTCKAIVTWR